MQLINNIDQQHLRRQTLKGNLVALSPLSFGAAVRPATQHPVDAVLQSSSDSQNTDTHLPAEPWVCASISCHSVPFVPCIGCDRFLPSELFLYCEDESYFTCENPHDPPCCVSVVRNHLHLSCLQKLEPALERHACSAGSISSRS